jgi:outer membrane immunogenic protein
MKSLVRKGLAVAALAVAAVVPAAAPAADFPGSAPVIQYYQPVVAVYNWTSAYLGLYGGGALGDRNATTTEPASPAGVPYNAIIGPNPYSYALNAGWLAGGTFGIQYQPQGRHVVVGLEGEVGYLHIARQLTDPNVAPVPNGVEQTRFGEFYAVAALRIGAAFDRVLIYGKGGAAVVNKHFAWVDTCTVGACGPLTLDLTRKSLYVTWAAGGGVEFAINNFWTIKAEYLYLATRENFSTSSFASDGTPVSTTHTDPGVHTAKIGVNYLFK